MRFSDGMPERKAVCDNIPNELTLVRNFGTDNGKRN